ncbi:hypothetical protein C8R43DRAFT_1121239 [Mycena crocata]|nr:hypothetical protein C8R43DRAFT_1121239 [Mycena crocata]
MTTTLPESTEDQDNSTLLALLARLNLRPEDPQPQPPRTPSPPPYSSLPLNPIPRPHTLPRVRPRAEPPSTPTVHRRAPPANPARYHLAFAPVSETVYRFDSPGNSGYTNQWSIAGAATQGVANASVHRVQHASPHGKRVVKAAYVIFVGTDTGVFFTWLQTKPLVSGVKNCIFRGYATVTEAYRAFEYAQARSWVRVVSNAPVTHPIQALPQPQNPEDNDEENPLNGDEPFDGNSLWYIVYRGITPGVYRSHLECQLNTLGRTLLRDDMADQTIGIVCYHSFPSTIIMAPCPPMKSKFITGPTAHEIQIQRQAEQNEKARLRMAKYRAELKCRSWQEQELAAQRARVHQATYREKHRNDLRLWEAARRVELYKKRFGDRAYVLYARNLRAQSRRRRAKREAKEAYHESQTLADPE